MLILSKDNITEYLKSQVDFLDYSRPLVISAVGEGTAEEDGDGFINFVFRVSDGKYNLIVKQCRSNTRMIEGLELPTDRCELEYETMMIRKAIVPEYIPELYHIDHENKVFITEDVSYLRIMRFQMNKSIHFEKFAHQIGTYMARSAFYTSEYYLDTKEFRKLSIRFMNTQMRSVMETFMFLLKRHEEEITLPEPDPDFLTFTKNIIFDDEVLRRRYLLRHNFMTKGECLIHGDLHTSNIFLGQDDMKIIDMEYTFCAPFSYDMGYLLGNFIAQYASSAFRPFENEEARRAYQTYILRSIHDIYTVFCDEFIKCWNEDCKPIYKGQTGLQEDFKKTVLQEAFGYAASACLSRTAGAAPFPDFDCIDNYVQKHNAQCLALILCKQFLVRNEEYETIDDVIRDFVGIEHIYKSNITEW